MVIIRWLKQWTSQQTRTGMSVKVMMAYKSLQYSRTTKKLTKSQTCWAKSSSRLNFLISYMRNCHIYMRSGIENNQWFGEHSNSQQRWRPQMPLSSGQERLPYAVRNWALLRRPKKKMTVLKYCSGRDRNSVAEGLALGKPDGRGKKCINCWWITLLKTEMKGIERWSRHLKISLKDLWQPSTKLLNMLIKHSLIRYVLGYFFLKTVTWIWVIRDANWLKSLIKNLYHRVTHKCRFVGKAESWCIIILRVKHEKPTKGRDKA